jgi:hypothetical protein
MSEYNIKHNDVHCISVDWDKKEFTFIYNKQIFTYKQDDEISATADTDHIRVAIDMFLLNFNKNMAKNAMDALKYLQKTMDDMQEAMSENEVQDSDYFEGKYQAYYELQQILLKIGDSKFQDV